MNITIVTPYYTRPMQIPYRAHDLTGQRKGTWTITSISSCERGTVFWNAQCECGKEKLFRAGNWRVGHGLSCSCHPKRPNYNQLAPGEASFNMLLSGYQRKARSRGITFTLTREQFRTLTESDCAYCGRPPSQIRKTTSGTPYTYTGVDRIDTARGYEEGNVAACCWYCNVSKHDRTLDEWKEHISALWERLCQPRP